MSQENNTNKGALQLVWFRSDLRTLDNTALSEAAARGPVIGVFLRCLYQWQEHGHGANKLDFLQRGVEALRSELEGYRIPLLHRDIDRFEAAPDALLDITQQYKVQALHFNQEYPLNEYRRDEAVMRKFCDAGIQVHSHRDSVAFAPGELLTKDDNYYKVFTPFSKVWHRRIDSDRLALKDEPEAQSETGIGSDSIPALPQPDNTPLDGSLWPAGQDAAAERLQRFLRYRAHHYKQQRDFPECRGTSELSPYLALGMISWRQCLQAVISENDGHLADGDQGLTAWVNELIWREFYQHIAVGFPRVCRNRPFQEDTEALEWRDDDSGFAAWCEGRTGYPIVDAGMRQLVSQGWMHNRLRMVTAMFLSKHLLIDWRRGEAFFMRHLMDGEFCSNNGGWQWAASTGTDAAPYFRIFNPTTQAERFDPQGEFIAEQLTVLADLPAKQRHSPPQEALKNLDYPSPIVDHKAARQRALDAFKKLKTQ